jgi:hypothetical protein
MKLSLRRLDFVELLLLGQHCIFYVLCSYMPPELLSEDYYGVEADYWGLGCIAF